MRTFLFVSLVLVVVGAVGAEEKQRQAPQVVLKSADGKTSVDLQKLISEGPVLVRLTCSCSGCDSELAYFQKLQAAYSAKGLQTVAVFQEAPEAASNYVTKKDVKFIWVSDPKGETWKTFGVKGMPCNILIDKGGNVVKVVSGCNKDGKTAQALSSEIAKLFKTKEVVVTESKGNK
jgi:peroxiredoxin